MNQLMILIVAFLMETFATVLAFPNITDRSPINEMFHSIPLKRMSTLALVSELLLTMVYIRRGCAYEYSESSYD